MSMDYYSIEDYGLYILPEDLEPYAEENDIDAIELAEDILELASYSDSNVEAVSYITGDDIDIDSNLFYVGQLTRTPSLFETAYESPEVALEELKASYDVYLPKDFDYKGRFAKFSGTMFG